MDRGWRVGIAEGFVEVRSRELGQRWEGDGDGMRALVIVRTVSIVCGERGG